MLLSVVIYPHSSLRKPTRELTRDEIALPETQTLIDNMLETMYQARGVGLAAPQINQDHRLTVIDIEDGKGPRVFINPQITNRSFRQETQDEGCLSLPDVFGLVKRPRLVTVTYLDREGQEQTLRANPFLSRVLQHEIDHLDGILFIDSVKKYTHGEDLVQTWERGEKPLLTTPYPYSYE